VVGEEAEKLVEEQEEAPTEVEAKEEATSQKAAEEMEIQKQFAAEEAAVVIEVVVVAEVGTQGVVEVVLQVLQLQS